MVALALASVVPGLPWLTLPEGLPTEGSHRAHLDALLAVSTSLLHRLACGLQRGISKYCCIAYSRSGGGCYQQTAFAYPAQASQMGSQLVGEDSADPLVVNTFGGRNRESPVALLLKGASKP